MARKEPNRRSILKTLSGASAGVIGLSSVGVASADPEVGTDDNTCGDCGGGGGGGGKEDCINRRYNPPIVNIDGGQCPEVYDNGDEWAEYVLATHSGLDECRTKSSVSEEIAYHRFDNDDGITLTCDDEFYSSLDTR